MERQSPDLIPKNKGFLARFRPSKPYENLHGSAGFASLKDVQKSGLLGNGGVYVGGFRDDETLRYLRHNGPEHVLAYAPTRSGKGVGLVLPTLLSWEASVVVLDIKGENWALTAGWRQKHAGNKVLRFAPGDLEGSVKFNPLAEIRLGTDHEVGDVQNIAMMIVDPDGKGLNDHWAKTGHSLIVGTALHCLYQAQAEKRVATIVDIAHCLANPERPIAETFQAMLTTPHKDGAVHPEVAQCAREMLNKADAELSGVVSTAMSFLTIYRDPIVAKNTSVSEFKISDLMNFDTPVSLYIVTPPSDKDRLKPLVRLLINQIVRTLTRTMKFEGGRSVKQYKHRLLLLLDEFPSLGKLDIFQESLAYIAGYGIKAYLITQDMAQLHREYGKDESIVSNCHIRIAYAPNKTDTAEMLSRALGTTTINKKSVSVSRKPGLLQSPQYTESWQEISRPLLTPEECGRVKGPQKESSDENSKIVAAGDMLIMMAGARPILGEQILYFRDPIFSARATVDAPPTDRCNHAATEKAEESSFIAGMFHTPAAPLGGDAGGDGALPGARVE